MTSWWREVEVLSESDRSLIERAVDVGRDGGIPGVQMALARREACDLLVARFGEDSVRHSLLGPEWSSDLDVHVSALPDRAELLDLGWLPLDDLLGRLGRTTTGRWAVRSGGRVIGAADFTDEPPPDPEQQVARRARSIDVRAVLELRHLQRNGSALPDDWAVRACAALEHQLGGDELAHISFDRRDLTAAQLRRAKATAVRWRRGPGLGLAVSGVDGAGKSTLLDDFVCELELAGVPHGRLWARPGYDLGLLDRAAVGVKRLLGKQPEPGVRAMGADDTPAPASRSGRAAAVWKYAVLADYLVKVRRRAAAIDGVVVFDRYDVDAEATLGFAYGLEGEWLGEALRRGLRRPDVHVWLDVDAETAAARKPDDPMGRQAIADQIARYERLLPAYPGIVRLDATRPVRVLIDELWGRLLRAARHARP